MQSAFKEKRAGLDLALSMGIAAALVILNVSISFVDSVSQFFSVHSRYPVTDIIINFMLFWIACLMWLAFSRWRACAKARADLLAVLSGISPDALLVVSPQCEIVMCNDSATRLFGYDSSELLHRKTDVLYMDRRQNKANLQEIHRALEQDGFHVGYATGKTKNGRDVPLEIISGDIPGRAGAVLLLRDISERIRQENERQKLETTMQQQQRMESLGELARGIAHDFNNMLTGILGNADLALEDLPPESPIKANIDVIVSTGKRAAKLCQELLAYAGQGKVEVEPIDLSYAVRDMQHFIRASVARKCEIVYDLKQGLPLVNGDVTRMREILVILITNASDAVGDREGTVTIRSGSMPCDATYLESCRFGRRPDSGVFAYVAVADNGCGMSDETCARIFEPFFSTKPGASGLGLPAVLGIISSHGGAIHVESAPGRGSTITALFPVASLQDNPHGSAPGLPAAPVNGVALVADDEEAVRSVLSRVLDRMGFSHVILAADGREALELFKAHAADICLVILDMTMPRLSGDEVFKAIRKLDDDVPVILTSGYGEDAAIGLFDSQRPAAFLQKPYEPSVLTEKIADVLRSQSDGADGG